MKCVICNIDMPKKIRDLYYCPTCGLISSKYRTDSEIYDKDYYDKYCRYSLTRLGKEINNFRWSFVKEHISGGLVLDYGCGSGHFIDLSPEDGFFVHGYDINPFSKYSQTGLMDKYTAVTFWDSLEHLDDPYTTLSNLNTEWVFCTIPDPTDFKITFTDWLHYRPHEHIHHFTKKSFERLMDKLSFKIVRYSNGEGRLRNHKHPTWLLTAAARRV